MALSGATSHMPVRTRIGSSVSQIKFINLPLKFINYVITLAVYQFLPTCVKYFPIGNFLVRILALIEKKSLPNKCNGLVLLGHYLHILGGILRQRLKAKWF